MDLYLSIQTL